jgi:hypothetical protein
MSELDDFLTPTLDRQLEAEKALCNGDPEPRLAMWSTQEPVTILGAMKGRHRVRGSAASLSLAGNAVLQPHRLPLRARGRRRQRGPGLHRRLRARLLLHGRRPGRADYLTGHPRLPTRGRRVEDRPPPRRRPPDRSAPFRRGIHGVSVPGRAWSALGPHGTGNRWSRAGTSGRPRRIGIAGHSQSAATTGDGGAALDRVRGLQGVPSCLGHVQAYQTISSRRALSTRLKNQ